MKVKTHRLYETDSKAVTFEKTPNKGNKLTNNKPLFIVVHYTAGPSLASAVNWFQDKSADASAHLVIDHDGSMVQMVKFNEKAWHAGKSSWQDKSGLNRFSVGIELANWGELKGENGNWKSWTGVSIPDERVIVDSHKHQSQRNSGWEIFDDKQIEACVQATKAIATAYNIDDENILGHEDISPGRKIDPGPLFDMDRFKARVVGRKSDASAKQLYRVTAANGLNMRKAPGIEGEKITKLESGTRIMVIEKNDPWWLVSVVVGGLEDQTGWVHSRWLLKV